MRILLFFILTIFYCIPSLAQKITIYSSADKGPIPNVAVYNKDKSKSGISDFDGVVDISSFLNSEMLYFHHVSHEGMNMLKSEIGSSLILKSDENKLSEIVISISKWEQEKKDVTQKIVSISANDITKSTPQTSADLLQSSGQVFIQKSQLGGGSPIIRGFSTNRLLLTVDGVRMNTAIFRGGNVQNVISVDPFTIDRTEIILGPGSVVYGSDAVGGVMNFYTALPKLGTESKNNFSGNGQIRYASASNEKTAHVDLNYGLNKWAFLSSFSYTDFDDLKMGTYGPDSYLRDEYVSVQNGQDVIVQNENRKKQVYTGYDQINLMQKILFKPNEKWNFTSSLIYTQTSDYPRYDRLIRRRNGQLRSAEWYYGPQKWFMGNIQISHKSNSLLYDNMKVTAAYQYFAESRNDRNFGSTTLSSKQEQVDAYSLNWDFEKKFSNHLALYYGLEYVMNDVGSNGFDRDIITNEIEDIPSRYPDGSTWQSMAAYTSVKYKVSEKFRVLGGLRYNRVLLNSEFDKLFFDFPFTEAKIDTDALTGTAGISWLPNDILQWKLNFSTAFRAPNVDDVGKIFDSEPGSVVVPNPDLKPEFAYNGEIGVRLNVHKNFVVDLSTYYTHLKDALIRRDYSLNGETEINFAGELSNVQAIQNAASSEIYGFEAGLEYKINEQYTLTSQYTYVGGFEETEDGDRAASRHVSPQFGTTKINYTKSKLSIDISAMYNGELDFIDLAPSEQRKEFLYALDENGNPYAPSWYTLNLRTQYEFTSKLKGIFSIENITDQRYRPYSSGLTASGRNFIASLRYSL